MLCKRTYKNQITLDKFLSLAIQGKADYIVSGDKHLFELGKYRTTIIASLKDFLSLF
jgi:uncharacterized protein